MRQWQRRCWSCNPACLTMDTWVSASRLRVIVRAMFAIGPCLRVFLAQRFGYLGKRDFHKRRCRWYCDAVLSCFCVQEMFLAAAVV